MGSRLGVVIRKTTGWELYYDHWGAQTIGADIALDGTGETLARVRQMRPMGVDSPQDWTGATWIEGSLLIDLTTRTVVWAEESEGLYLPRLINALIEVTWPGWSAVWSAEGTRGVLAAAGIDPTTIFADPSHDTRSLEDQPWFGPWDDLQGDEAFSVVLEDGRLVPWRGQTNLDIIAELGPDSIRLVTEQALERSGAGEPLLWDERPRTRRPDTGVYIDYRTRTFRWWSVCDDDYGLEAFAGQWPGWTVESMGDNYEWHERLLNRTLRTWADDVAECRKEFGRMTAEGRRANPAVPVLGFLEEQGADVQINAPVFSTVPASREARSDIVLRYLDSLDRADPLPPARFIDRHGTVHWQE